MPPTSLTFTLLTEPSEVLSQLGRLVEREPESLSVLASVTGGLVTDPARYVGPRWWVGRDAAGEAVAAFMHTPPHPMHIALAGADAARALARLLADEGDDLPGVSGLREPAEAFADQWCRRTGHTATVDMEIGRFDLPVRARLPFEVSGSYRVATADDAVTVDDWHQAFVDTIERRGRVAPSLHAYITAGRVGLWTVGGRAVSMAYASPSNGGVTRISGVWTPPELRGHGYASAVVTALSAERQDAGEACMLYTDLANPTSNAIYQAIGYRRRVGDSIAITFSH